MASRCDDPARERSIGPLIVGSLLFGIGWGLAGICPGPGIVLLGYGAPKGVVFVLVICVTMIVFDRARRRTDPS